MSGTFEISSTQHSVNGLECAKYRLTMPELPDILLYLESLAPRISGRRLLKARVLNPFVLRSVEPPIRELEGEPVLGIQRLGKRIALDFGDGLFLVIHLMISGRLRWFDQGKEPKGKPGGRIGHAAFE